MKKFNIFICGIASIFTYSNEISSEAFQKFPSSYNKKSEKSLQDTWLTVGKTIRGAMMKYGKEENKSLAN